MQSLTIPKHLFVIAQEVKAALADNWPVVALESTIITHGMEYPVNRDTALAVEKIVRDHGAIPATIAIIKGVIRVGLTKEDIEMLSTEGKKNSRKCSRRDLAYVIANKMNGSTTWPIKPTITASPVRLLTNDRGRSDCTVQAGCLIKVLSSPQILPQKLSSEKKPLYLKSILLS